MTGFFQPPPNPRPEQAPASNSPRWTGRPHGRQVSEAVSHLLIGRSGSAAVSIAYLDAYPDGFELEISGTASVPYRDLCREGDDFGPDIFGRNWPLADAPNGTLPLELLRVGVQFSDGRVATSVGGHDRPVDGPVITPLSGGTSGRGGEPGPDDPGTRFHQGYWISPLPPQGSLTVVCEWPALGIPEVRLEIDAHVVLDAAERARTLFRDGRHVLRDGRAWPLGAETDVAFISAGVAAGTAVGGMIPATYPGYCTVEVPGGSDDAVLSQHEHAVVELLIQETAQQSWWLGYLDTGGGIDVVFPYAPRTSPFHGHQYVLVEAGPEQAARWRERGFNWALPDLMFAADRSWLLSTGWDDTWTCVGGPEQLITSLVNHPLLGPRTQRVSWNEAAGPLET